jgi:hypothetical protein
VILYMMRNHSPNPIHCERSAEYSIHTTENTPGPIPTFLTSRVEYTGDAVGHRLPLVGRLDWELEIGVGGESANGGGVASIEHTIAATQTLPASARSDWSPPHTPPTFGLGGLGVDWRIGCDAFVHLPPPQPWSHLWGCRSKAATRLGPRHQPTEQRRLVATTRTDSSLPLERSLRC